MTIRDGPVDVDWTETTTSYVSNRTVLLLVGLGLLGGLYLYDYVHLGAETVVIGYDIGRLEWLWITSLWVLTVYGSVPVLHHSWTDTLRHMSRRRPASVLAGIFLTGVFLAGTLGPVLFSQPTPSFEHANQPPLFTSISNSQVVSCVNQVGDRCHGSWKYPLGTTGTGTGLFTSLVFGARITVMLSITAITFIVPVATIVGTLSAYLGGKTDRLLTGVAEALKLIPALLVFLVWRWVSGESSLFALAVAFGLVNWGNVAILVRSRALNEISKNYIRSAEAAGAETLDVVRHHLVPNVSRSAIGIAVYQIPLFITVEATLSFLKFGNPPSYLLATPPSVESWGRLIGRNVNNFQPYWWRLAVPVATLFLTILSANVVADAIQRLLDPRSTE